MNKIKAIWNNGMLWFNHFVVKKESDAFVGVYHRYGPKCGPLISSDETLKGAAKKAKLLEIGYQLGAESMRDCHQEQCRYCSV